MINYCNCGCGEVVKNKYKTGHAQRRPEERLKRSKIATRINTGRVLSLESKQKIALSLLGTKHTEQTKQKMSDFWTGKNLGRLNTYWKGKGGSKYGSKWTDRLKRQIKQRDNFECQNLNCTKNFKSLEVHHIDKNKQNNNPTNLITLCSSCHKLYHFDTIQLQFKKDIMEVQ